MASTSSVRSAVTPKSKNMYKWILLGLVIVLGILVIVSFTRAKREKFENGAGTIMYFFMPGCGHCERLNPEWEKVQPIIDMKRLPLRLNKIDGTNEMNKELVNQYEVKGYPTVVLEIGSKSYVYDGERTAEALIDWASKKLGK